MPPTSRRSSSNTHGLVSDRAVQQQFHSKRIVHHLDQIALEVLILPRAAADGTDLHVCVVRVRVLDFVVRARGDAVEAAIAGLACGA